MKVRNIKPVVAVILALGSLGAMSAHADGFYAGGSLGVPNYEAGMNGVSGNGSGASGKVYGGYQFTPNFALEVGAANLGSSDGNNGTMSGMGQYVDAVGTLPLNNKWALLGSLGVANVSVSTSNGNDSGNGLKLGLGAEYSLTRTVALRAEWERYQPQVFGSAENIDQYSVGAKVAF